MTIKIVTVATEEKYHFINLKKSIENQNTELNVLGKGLFYKGHYMKDELLLDFCNNYTNDNDIILFCDGYDSIITGDLNELEDKFIKLKVPILISTDTIHTNYNPLTWITKYIYYKTFPLNINTGLFIGYSKNIKNLLNKLKVRQSKNLIISNQKAWGYYIKDDNLTNKEIFFDNNNFFYNYSSIYYDSIPLKVINNNLFRGNKQIYVLQAPTNSNINNICKLLGYKQIKYNCKTLFSNVKKIKYYYKSFLREFLAFSGVIVSFTLFKYLK